nr:fimbria/pilus outer membrane usher protein [Serratia sp. P2ACOL2]
MTLAASARCSRAGFRSKRPAVPHPQGALRPPQQGSDVRRQLKRRTAVPRRLALLIALALGGPAQARDYFNPALLELDGPQQGVTSLATFEENGSQLPGDYRVDILLNDQQVDSRMLTFAAGADGQGLSGVALADNNLSWGVQQTYGTRGQGYGGNTNLDYRGTYGEVTGGYGYDKNSRRLNYGLSGSLVAHANGITLGQPLGETAALVAAPGAAGARVSNQTGVRTDWRGYALVPYLSPYRRSEVALDAGTLAEDVDLPQGSIVGDGGQVYLSGLAARGKLQVKWGNGGAEQCRVNYQLPQSTPEGGVSQIASICR